jgi:hypothetical protein
MRVPAAIAGGGGVATAGGVGCWRGNGKRRDGEQQNRAPQRVPGERTDSPHTPQS